jgi:hypothetical protein
MLTLDSNPTTVLSQCIPSLLQLTISLSADMVIEQDAAQDCTTVEGSRGVSDDD